MFTIKKKTILLHQKQQQQNTKNLEFLFLMFFPLGERDNYINLKIAKDKLGK